MTPDPIPHARMNADEALTEFTQDQAKTAVSKPESASEVLRAIEWINPVGSYEDGPFCPCCRAQKEWPPNSDHSPNCRLAAALANLTPAPSGDDVAELRAENERLRDDSKKLIGMLADRALELGEAKARVTELERFADYVLMWRDRGPPHGDPVTAWSAVSGHPVVGRRARTALSQHQKGEGHE